ncbi:SGNH/GDSL hydrolase family protein [Piscirickettsia salmonis]|uniref:SGNH/GDSL hydrolase family protein n=1 Tax=Piscirickettsia salmonis TaxID=1238 RepID=UPI0007C8BE2D|nr:Thermolabile hemolysin precursor [Piscirickettsiaceae bacterium NZ-RLO1]
MHYEELYAQGYKNFVLFNLPDLAKTPRYQKESAEEQKNAREVIEYFNTRLAEKVAILQGLHSDCKFELFDAHGEFDHIYQNLEEYDFDPNKCTSCLDEDEDYDPKAAINPEKRLGYMFWNDVHPTSSVQRLLAEKFIERIEGTFDFYDGKMKRNLEESIKNQPKKDLVEGFIHSAANHVKGAAGGSPLSKKTRAALTPCDFPQDIKLPRSIKTVLKNAYVVSALNDTEIDYGQFKDELRSAFKLITSSERTRYFFYRSDGTQLFYENVQTKEDINECLQAYANSCSDQGSSAHAGSMS